MGSDLEAELRWIEGATHPELKAAWSKYCPGWHLPRKTSVQFLRLAIAWKAQERILGGLSEEAKALLHSPSRNKEPVKAKADVILPGTILRREWQGGLYEVMTLEKGFAYEGETYGSLSEIARIITGTRWNGPAFFGLRSRRKKSEGRRPALMAAE